MNGLEDLLRDSLRQRAEDVEPTPALWREVDRRIARRRRLQVTSWSLAGVAAALAALIVVPGVLGGNGSGPLEIEPLGPRTAGIVPATAVVAGGGELWLLDLASGERTTLDVGSGETIEQIAVRPGSTVDDYRLAVVHTTPTGGGLLSFVDGPEAGGVSGVLAEHAVEPEFVPTVTWSPQGELVAYTVPGDGGSQVVIEEAPDGEGFLDPEDAAVVGTIGEDDVLLDWVGPVSEAGDTSTLFVRRVDGTVGIIEVEVEVEVGAGGRQAGFVLSDTPPMPDVFATVDGRLAGAFAVASARATSTTDGRPLYALAPGEDGTPSLMWLGEDSSPADVVEVSLGGVVGDVAPDRLWLDASQDAALVGDGERMWLFFHDGAGDVAPAVELAEGTVGALFDAPRSDIGGDASTPGDGASEPGPADADNGEPRPTVELPAPIVTVSGRELTLVGPDGATTLVALGPEGSGRFISAPVRPGSTVDDLTVVALTEAEGLYDLRHLHYVDGEVVTWEAFGQPYNPGVGGSAGEGTSIRGPVWSPDGGHLAWFEWGTGPAALRTVGWRDGPGTGDTATDNAMFALDELGATPLVPVEWVSLPGRDGRTELRAILAGANPGWVGVPLQLQDDGAVALPAGGSVSDWTTDWPVGGTDTGQGLSAAFGPDGEVSWLVVQTPDGVELLRDPATVAERIALPAELSPAETPTQLFLRAVGDEVIVANGDTGAAYLVAENGEVTRIGGEILDVDVVD